MLVAQALAYAVVLVFGIPGLYQAQGKAVN
jgi:hypothetical protein